MASVFTSRSVMDLRRGSLALASRCSQILSRATRKLWSRVAHTLQSGPALSCPHPFLGSERKRQVAAVMTSEEEEEEEEKGEEEAVTAAEDKEVWRRTILMGKKCQGEGEEEEEEEAVTAAEEKEVWRRTILMGKKCQGEGEVWRRTILMGEKCQPLDFPGVIYYDADGQQLSEVPPPRTPPRSPLQLARVNTTV